jgi:hypothetical protein
VARYSSCDSVFSGADTVAEIASVPEAVTIAEVLSVPSADTVREIPSVTGEIQ